MHSITLFVLYLGLVTFSHGERTKDKMYKSIHDVAPCFRRLNATHQTGCTSSRSGSTGVVHIIRSLTDLHFILANGTAGPYIPVMPISMFSSETAYILKNSDIISGLALHKVNITPTFYSHEDTCPNRHSSLSSTCSNNWNPHGTSLLHEDFPFPIFYISNNEELQKIEDCFKKFNDFDYASQNVRSLCSLELTSFMIATTDTPTCIRRSNGLPVNFNSVKFCDPLGDENVWASLFPIANTSESKVKNNMKYIILSTRIDTTSFFLDVVPGASNPITGMVTLLSTAQLLKQILEKNEDYYNYNVLFFLLNGETYDYIGSQRMVYDMEKGVFPQPLKEKDEFPIKPIQLEDIALFVEFSQLNFEKGVHIFTNKDSAEEKRFTTFLNKYKASDLNLVVEKSGIIPPASLQTFVKAKPNISGLILADHSDTYSNQYYNSIFDNTENIKFEYYNDTEDIPKDSIQYFVANVSNMVASSVYEEITSTPFTGKDRASVATVNELFNCYLLDSNCKIHQAIQRKKLKYPYSLYVSVSLTRNPITTLAGLTLAWFTGDIVKGNNSCVNPPKSNMYHYFNMSKSMDDLNNTVCFKTIMNFTEALSPAFIIENYNWSSGQYSSWSESQWTEIQARLFLKPSAAQEHMTIAIGSLILVFSFVIVYFVKSRSHILFPQAVNISPTDC